MRIGQVPAFVKTYSNIVGVSSKNYYIKRIKLYTITAYPINQQHM